MEMDGSKETPQVEVLNPTIVMDIVMGTLAQTD
jgi:hypothetical protein